MSEENSYQKIFEWNIPMLVRKLGGYVSDTKGRSFARLTCSMRHVNHFTSICCMEAGTERAHRAREAGWSLEELAYYLGHVTVKGTPAIQTTIRYTQVSRAHVKEKLKLLKG
jgi:hypothetical protein